MSPKIELISLKDSWMPGQHTGRYYRLFKVTHPSTFWLAMIIFERISLSTYKMEIPLKLVIINKKSKSTDEWVIMIGFDIWSL